MGIWVSYSRHNLHRVLKTHSSLSDVSPHQSMEDALSFHERTATSGVTYLQDKPRRIIDVTRLYTQLDISSTGPIAQSRQGISKTFQEEGGNVESSSITAEEVLEQANRIFAPYKLKFASPISWFAVWKSELLCHYPWNFAHYLYQYLSVLPDLFLRLTIEFT